MKSAHLNEYCHISYIFVFALNLIIDFSVLKTLFLEILNWYSNRVRSLSIAALDIADGFKYHIEIIIISVFNE